MNYLMKLNCILLTAFSLVTGTFAAQSAFARGADGSGGGGTHTCYNADGSIRSTLLYDFYEGQALRHYKLIQADHKTPLQLLDYAMRKIYSRDPAFARSVLDQLQYYAEHRSVEWNKKFSTLPDAAIVFVDQGCEYRQIAQWRGDFDDTIFIDGNLNQVFSQNALNIAGLALHEAVYAVLRKQDKMTDSDFARDVVAQAFSDQSVDRITDWPKLTINNAPHKIRISSKNPRASQSFFMITTPWKKETSAASYYQSVLQSETVDLSKKGPAITLPLYLDFDAKPVLVWLGSYDISGEVKAEVLENEKVIYRAVFGREGTQAVFVMALPYDGDFQARVNALNI